VSSHWEKGYIEKKSFYDTGMSGFFWAHSVPDAALITPFVPTRTKQVTKPSFNACHIVKGMAGTCAGERDALQGEPVGWCSDFK